MNTLPAPIESLDVCHFAQFEIFTVAMIRAASGCTEWAAKQAIKEAHAAGILDKTGDGGATRYRYSNKLRTAK